MKREHAPIRAWLWLAAALPALSAVPALADIPTTTMTADGGPGAPPPKTTAPRAEQRTSEQRPSAAPALG